MVLHNKGVIISEKIVRRLMLESGLHVFYKKRRGYSSYQGAITVAPANELNQNFNAGMPNEKWLTDITEMAAADGKVYLSPIIDCFDGLVVTWKMSRNPNANLTNGMLNDAIKNLPEQRSVFPSYGQNTFRSSGVRKILHKPHCLDNRLSLTSIE